MITMAQRIEELRTERGLSRPALAAALGFPKNAPEKFETGRATPTKEQQDKMADFFGVSLFYLKGESNDRTRMEGWLQGNFAPEDDSAAHVPMKPTKKAFPSGGRGTASAVDEGTTGRSSTGTGLFDSFLHSKQFCDLVEATILDVLRSEEGQELIANVVRKELMKQK